MKKRLFIAIPLSENLKNQLIIYKNNLRTKKINWTKIENLHITVQFLGEIEQGFLFSIIKKIENATKDINTFTIEFDKIIFAPPNKTPRMIWAIFSDDGSFQELVDAVSGAMEEFIAPISRNENVMRKKRIAHVTLARFNDSQIVHSLHLAMPKIKNKSFDCQRIELWQSTLTRNGPIYKNINKFFLTKHD